jgi:uncharacterized UBP type Zn finger protein
LGEHYDIIDTYQGLADYCKDDPWLDGTASASSGFCYFTLQKIITCVGACPQSRTGQTETFANLTATFQDNFSPLSIDHFFRDHFAPTPYIINCPNCGGEQFQTTSFQFRKDFLIIVVARATSVPTGRIGENGREIYREAKLKNLITNFQELSLPTMSGTLKYKLVAVAYHIGDTVLLGHFVAITKNRRSTGWTSRNDSFLTNIPEMRIAPAQHLGGDANFLGYILDK